MKLEPLGLRWGFSCLLIILISGPLRGQENPWKGSVRTEKGIRIVENPRKPMYASDILELQEEYVIKDSGERYQLNRPGDLAIDALNRLYVLDWKDSNVKVFDEHGRFLRLIGKQGIGPGELQSPGPMAISGNRLAVHCFQLARMTYYSLEGKLLETKTALSMFSGLAFSSKGDAFGITLTHADINKPFYELRKYNAELKYQKTIASQHKRPLRLLRIDMPVFKMTRDDKIIYGFPETYEFKVFDSDGKIVAKIRKAHRPIPVPREEKDRFLKMKIPEDFMQPAPGYYEPFYSLDIDEEGRMIVGFWRPKTGETYITYDVFSPDGKFLATVDLPVFRNRLWADKRLYTVEEDEDGLPIIRVRRVNWKYR